MTDPLLEMKGITKSFPGVKALDGVSFDLNKSEIHALVGENGAGKSTLIKILAGVYPHPEYGGEITLDGTARRFANVRESENAGIAVIYQELSLVKDLGVAENIFLGREPRHFGVINWEELYSRAQELLNDLHLGIDPLTPVRNLGIGQQQLVEIAKALSQETRILVLDEPTAALTDAEVETLFGILHNLRARGVAMIYISHKLDEVFRIGRPIRRPKRLNFPLMVKSLTQEASIGISQASVVSDDQKLAERVEFIHRQTSSHAIAEQYIEGREIYVGVIGNRKLQTYTPWELTITNLPEGALNIATGRLKWNPDYQKKVGLVTKPADLPPELQRKILLLSKRIYRHLSLSGYARLDYRMTSEGECYLLEANPNPQIAKNEDFADSAAHCGLSYPQLLHKIITLGLSYNTAEYIII